jgi:hypothetical protein
MQVVKIVAVLIVTLVVVSGVFFSTFKVEKRCIHTGRGGSPFAPAEKTSCEWAVTRR